MQKYKTMKVFLIITLVITFIAICYWVILNDAEEIDQKAPFYDDEFETED